MMYRLTPVVVALCVLPFSSCTCSSSTPPPAAVPTRMSGFGGIKPNARQVPDVAREDVIAPQAVATKAPPTLLATPLQSKLPENFPSDVPVFAGAEVMAVQQMANKANNVVFGVDAERPQVFSFYKDTMKNSGWNATQEYQGKEQSFLSFKKDDVITNVSISTDPKTGKKVIAIMYYTEEPLPFPEF